VVETLFDPPVIELTLSSLKGELELLLLLLNKALFLGLLDLKGEATNFVLLSIIYCLGYYPNEPLNSVF